MGIRCGTDHAVGDGRAIASRFPSGEMAHPGVSHWLGGLAWLVPPDARNWDNLGMEVFSRSVRSTALAVRESSFRTGSGHFGKRTTLSAVVPVVRDCQGRKVKSANAPCSSRSFGACLQEFRGCLEEFGQVSAAIRLFGPRILGLTGRWLSGTSALDLWATDSP